MSKSRILAALVTVVASTSICKADTCPSQSFLNDENITDLSHTGETTITGKVYKMVGKDKTHNDYKGKLLDTQKHLEGFVKIAKADGGATVRSSGHTTGFVSVQTPEGYCAYNISVGKQSAVIALSENPDQLGAKPPLPSTPSPSTPPRPSRQAPTKF